MAADLNEVFSKLTESVCRGGDVFFVESFRTNKIRMVAKK